MKTTQTNTRTEAARTPAKDLWCGMLDVTSINRDWSTGYAETWESHEAHRCEECGEIVVNAHDGDRHCDVDSETECEGHCGSCEGPMMNYYYPLPEWDGDASEAAKTLVDLPLCLVEFTEEGAYGLALTGGGMDLSWEICEAFMLLGYLPPVHFARLPAMAGRGMSKRDKWILSGCRRALQVRRDQTGSALRRLREEFRA